MFNFSFSLNYPFGPSWKMLCEHSYRLTKNKTFELTVSKSRSLIDVSAYWTVRRDHAGFGGSFGLFFYSVDFDLTDNRHWDYVNGCWEVYEEE